MRKKCLKCQENIPSDSRYGFFIASKAENNI